MSAKKTLWERVPATSLDKRMIQGVAVPRKFAHVDLTEITLTAENPRLRNLLKMKGLEGKKLSTNDIYRMVVEDESFDVEPLSKALLASGESFEPIILTAT